MKLIPFVVFALVALLCSCATVQRDVLPPRRDEFSEREKIVEYAWGMVGRKDLEAIDERFRNDCSGFVIGIYRSLGYRVKLNPLRGTSSVSQALFHALGRRNLLYRSRIPKKADVVFFSGTTERRTSGVSHVGIVLRVLDDGTILMVHYSSKGVQELRMNLREPDRHRAEDGTVKNDFLRKTSAPGGRLSGQLFYCFGDLLRYVKGTHVVSMQGE